MLKKEFQQKISVPWENQGGFVNDTLAISDSINPKNSEPVTAHIPVKIDQNKNFEIIKQEPQAWINILLLGILLIYTMVQYLNFNRVGQFFLSVMSKSQANQLLKEGSLFKKWYALILQFIALSTISLFVQYVLGFYHLDNFLAEGFEGFAMILMSLSALWVIKAIAVNFSGYLMNTTDSSREYNNNMLIFFSIFGLMLIPVIILMIYLDKKIFIYVGIILWIVLFFLWIIRGLSVGMQESNFSKLHLFLYLCTFEILPVIVLTKIILEAN